MNLKERPLVKRDLDHLVLQMHASGLSYADAVREFKRRFLLEVLAKHRGNQCKAAEELGMHRNTLSRTLTELDMDSAQIKRGLRRPPASVRPLRSARPGLQIVAGGSGR
jgi:Fis family transcriptional regulator, factor for inversion stimulation protein